MATDNPRVSTLFDPHTSEKFRSNGAWSEGPEGGYTEHVTSHSLETETLHRNYSPTGQPIWTLEHWSGDEPDFETITASQAQRWLAVATAPEGATYQEVQQHAAARTAAGIARAAFATPPTVRTDNRSRPSQTEQPAAVRQQQRSPLPRTPGAER